jgi:hypothetical protein
LYPFVGAWNPTLVELAGIDFDNIKRLKAKILDELRSNWLAIENENLLDYYQGLIDFREEYQYPLRIFSLNYDRCLELTCQKRDISLELGFNKEKIWNWRRFSESNEIPEIYFYKLHGSIDWKYEKEKLTYTDAQSKIEHEDAALIFGTTYKLQYRDPFLFLAYEFRKYAIDAKLIICIGYGFGDEHINKIIQQALVQDKNHLLLSVSPIKIEEGKVLESRKIQQEKIAKLIDQKNSNQIVDQIVCWEYKAKQFMSEKMKIENMGGLFSDEYAPFATIK